MDLVLLKFSIAEICETLDLKKDAGPTSKKFLETRPLFPEARLRLRMQFSIQDVKEFVEFDFSVPVIIVLLYNFLNFFPIFRKT